MSDIFIKSTQGEDRLGSSYQAAKEVFRKHGKVTGEQASAVVSLESRARLSPADTDALGSLRDSMVSMFKNIHDKISPISRKNKDGVLQVSDATLESRALRAMSGALMAHDTTGASALQQRLQMPGASGTNGVTAVTVEAIGRGNHDRRTVFTAEAFKNYDLDNSRIFSTLFNYSIVDFDDFIRTVWRPVTISPDSSFVELLVNVLTVFNGYEHTTDGKFKNWERNNLVRAIADHTILHTDLTKAVPVVRPDAAEFFMDPAIVAPVTIEVAGRPVQTAPLKTNAGTMDLIGLCMPDWLINKNGILDQRDNLDPGISFEKVVVALANDVLEFETTGFSNADFNRAPQGDQQRVINNWTNTAFVVTKLTKNADGTALSDLASVVTGELVLKIRVDLQADINFETGESSVNSGPVQIRSLQDKDGNNIAPTDARYVAIKAALAGAKEVGFVLRAFRSNADRRQRGQLINIRQFAENVVVPWRDPIAAERPAHGSTEQDTADLTALMSATRIRIHNEGVTALLENEVSIAHSAELVRNNNYDTPTTVGVGRHYVIPTYVTDELDMLKIVDSLKSSERNSDIQAAIVATLRNRLAHAYTDSQYKAASDALSGGTKPKPKVALVTDPVTARYIIEPGELRTLVDFELVVVPILDFRMRNKIKMMFITDDDGSSVDYLNFGYLFWSPEQVLVANMSRTGAYNRETQLQPRYRFYVACPIFISIEVKNIEAALAKMPLYVEDVTP